MTQAVPKEMPAEPASLGQTLENLVRILSSDEFSPQECATLRRMTPYQRPPVAFFRLAFRFLPETWEARRPEWVALVAGLTLMAPRPHSPNRPAGRVLAECGYSESRLERLLAADSQTLGVLIIRAAYFLGARKASIDWLDFAHLLFAESETEREEVRLDIARAYYRPIEARYRKQI